MNPYPIASHHFTTPPRVQATITSSPAEYFNSLLNRSLWFFPRTCSLQSVLAPCYLHDIVYCSPLSSFCSSHGCSFVLSILSLQGLGTWWSLCPDHPLPAFASGPVSLFYHGSSEGPPLSDRSFQSTLQEVANLWYLVAPHPLPSFTLAYFSPQHVLPPDRHWFAYLLSESVPLGFMQIEGLFYCWPIVDGQ